MSMHFPAPTGKFDGGPPSGSLSSPPAAWLAALGACTCPPLPGGLALAAAASASFYH
jgi:hypothetical protein